jgi:hypothetical protein
MLGLLQVGRTQRIVHDVPRLEQLVCVLACRFATYNVVGALVWTVLFLGAGYFFGNLPGRLNTTRVCHGSGMMQTCRHLQRALAAGSLGLIVQLKKLMFYCGWHAALTRHYDLRPGSAGLLSGEWCAELSPLLCCLWLQWFSTTSHSWCWALLLCQFCLYCWR